MQGVMYRLIQKVIGWWLHRLLGVFYIMLKYMFRQMLYRMQNHLLGNV